MKPKTMYGLTLSFVTGATLATMASFVLLVLSNPGKSIVTKFPGWLSYPVAYGWWPWPVLGGLCASALYGALLLRR